MIGITGLHRIGVNDMNEKDSKKVQVNQPDSRKDTLKEQELEQVAGGITWRDRWLLDELKRRGTKVPLY